MTDTDAWRHGARVKIHRAPGCPGPWPAEPTGRLGLGTAGELFHWEQTRQGRRRMYWVTFDEPQFDPDGDGPYACSEVLEHYIELLSDP